MVAGCIAWNAHALLDFNIHIPGTFLIVAVLPLLAIDFGRNEPSSPPKSERFGLALLCGLLTIVGIASWSRKGGEKSYQQLYNSAHLRANWEAIHQTAKTAVEQMPYSPYPWGLLGRIAISRNRIDVAEQAFGEAAKRTPHRAVYHAQRARCLMAMGSVEDADRVIREAILWYPTNENYQNLQAKIAYATQR